MIEKSDDNESKNLVPIGFVSLDRLADIPPEHHRRHEFLIYLFQQIQDLILNTQAKANRSFAVTIDENIDIEAFKKDPIKYAALQLPQAKKPIIDDVSLALLADFLAFTHTSFTAFEKRLFAPGYANLRKPLQENLLLLMWICGDDEDFFQRFLNDPSKDFKQMESDPKFRRDIYQKASAVGASSHFDFELVEQMVYDKTFSNGLAGSMVKAIHLFTGHQAIRTEDMNFNWIFKNPFENDVYDIGYYCIALVYLHAYPIIFSTCNRIFEPNKNLKLWLDVVLISCFEAIFAEKDPQIFRLFATELDEHLICMHCAQKFEFDTENIPQFLMLETITCKACGEFQQFPLFWTFCRNKLEDDEDEKSSS